MARNGRQAYHRVPAILAAALLLAIAGYHAVGRVRDLDALARLRRERPQDRPRLERTPRVSVLVAAWNESGRIAAHIGSALRLRYPHFEYILCAGGEDGTYDIAREALGGRGTLLRQVPGEGKQRALRRGLALATGEIVYLTDADCLVDDEALERVLEPVVRGAAAATGRSLPLPAQLANPSVVCAWAPQYVAEGRAGDSSRGLLGRNCAVRREAVLEAGGFEEDVPTGTDYHLARGLITRGATIAFARWSFVRTAAHESPRRYLRQQSRWLRNHWIHGRRTGDRPLIVHAMMSWLVGVLFFGLAAAVPLVGRPAGVALAAVMLHGSVARARYAAFFAAAEEIPFGVCTLLRCPLWFAIDAAAAARSLFDTLVPHRRGLW